MKVVYVAGPYENPQMGKDQYATVLQRILDAEKCGLALAALGIGVIVPHIHTTGWNHDPQIQPAYFYELDLELLRRADAVVMLPGWKDSRGATAEYAEALIEGKPVFYWPGHTQAIIGWANHEAYTAEEVMEMETHAP